MSEAGSAHSTRAVQRALRLLGAVAHGGGTLSELARAAALSPSTTSRLLGTLAAEELIRREDSGRYRPGPRLRQLAAVTLREDPLYELAGPHLEALAAETGETANLAVAADQERILYLRQVASPRLVQTATWAGRTVPFDGTALGEVLRGEVPIKGYVVRSGAVEPEVTSIAAPLFGPGDQIVGAISVLAPTYRTPARRASVLGRALVRHAKQLSLSLGASPRKRVAA